MRHALGWLAVAHAAGILLAEVQQNSDTTYQMHDWGRVGTICRDHCFANNLVMRACWDTMVFSPPLCITEAEIDEWAKLARIALDKTWADVNSAFGDAEILAFIPGTKHGTREVFEEKVLLAGCEASGALEAMTAAGISEDDAEGKCMGVRTDGRSVDIDGDYTETLARIDANPNGIGVFGLAFYENNTDKLKVATMSGIAPSTETIASGEYPVSRPLYFYVKNAHVASVPGMKEFLEEVTSEAAFGDEGYLLDKGLIPLSADKREALRAAIKTGKQDHNRAPSL